MTAKEFDKNYFKLVPSTQESSPITGIKISIDGKQNYQKDTTFRFTDETASKNAKLSDLTVTKGDVEGDDYRTYSLEPQFDEEVGDYTVKILDNIDEVDITATLSDENATMKIQLPQRDENGDLIFNNGGNTVEDIQYEENDDIKSGIPKTIKLNKLGEPDTKVTIKVTAEDKKSVKQYTILIHRPYGTIKGKIQLGENLRESTQMSYQINVQYIANVTLYNTGKFEWDKVIEGETSLEDLNDLEIQAQIQSNGEDGSYTIYVSPGQYDLMLERPGFLQYVLKGINIKEKQIIDVGNKILKEGDTDMTGVISLDDLVAVTQAADSTKGDGIYDERYDFGQKGFVAIDDIVSVTQNMDELITIDEYEGGD